MPNICNTSCSITGEKTAITHLWNILQKLEVSSCQVQLIEFAEALGIDYKQRNLYMRGGIWDAQVNLEVSDETAVLYIYTETAWYACHEFFFCMGEAIESELTISYMEIEPGCEIYSIHDENDSFDYVCYVAACGDRFPEAEGPYATIEEAVDCWCEIMEVAQGSRTEEEMTEFIGTRI